VLLRSLQAAAAEQLRQQHCGAFRPSAPPSATAASGCGAQLQLCASYRGTAVISSSAGCLGTLGFGQGHAWVTHAVAEDQLCSRTLLGKYHNRRV
jgi:hypothetical protein